MIHASDLDSRLEAHAQDPLVPYMHYASTPPRSYTMEPLDHAIDSLDHMTDPLDHMIDPLHLYDRPPGVYGRESTDIWCAC